MADYLGGMPVAPEVNSFQAEISGDERVVPRRNPQHGAIISDAGDQFPGSTSAPNFPADPLNQRLFTKRQSGININEEPGAIDEVRFYEVRSLGRSPIFNWRFLTARPNFADMQKTIRQELQILSQSRKRTFYPTWAACNQQLAS